MKATFRGKITKMFDGDLMTTSLGTTTGPNISHVVVTIDALKGRFEDESAGTMKEFVGTITLRMRPLHAEKLTYGQMITFTLDTEAGE